MSSNRFTGNLIRLCPVDIEKDAPLQVRWNRNSEFMKLSDIGPSTLYPVGVIKSFMEHYTNEGLNFMIESLDDGRRIGSIGLWGINWVNSNAWVGIGIGEPEYWGKGFGTEAMQMVLRCAFVDLNLHRVQLGVYEYNKRAIHSYENCGFKLEGVEREIICKEDRRWDSYNMGILRSEWLALQNT